MIRTNSERFFRCIPHDKKGGKLSCSEDKHVVNEHYVIPKSHDATQWCISMYHVTGLKQTRGIKNVTLKAGENFVGVAVYWEES